MKILITGICGFVGSQLAQYFRQAGWSVVGLDNLCRRGSETNWRWLKDSDVQLFHGDVRNASDVEALPKCDWLIDAAANPSVLAGVDGTTSSRQLVEHNLLGTINLLEYCKRHQAGFVLLSTSRVYSLAGLTEIQVRESGGAFHLLLEGAGQPGLSEHGLTEAFSTRPPVSLYGATKLASEVIALEYAQTFQFPIWINRCGVLAGAGQFGRIDQGIYTYWLNSWLRGNPLKYIGFGGHGYQVRDCLHPHDLARLVALQVAQPNEPAPRILNVSGGLASSISLRQLSDWCRNHWNLSREVVAQTEGRRFDAPWIVLSAAQAQAIWHWSPERTTENILGEIATHAEAHPDWLTMTGV